MKYYVADFETTTDEKDCRVWGYGISEIGKTYNFYYGNSIDDFMEFLEYSKEPCKIYMHNLRFDGNFIINWLEDHKFKFVRDKKQAADKTYTSLITKDGIYYNIEIYFMRDKMRHLANKVIFYDSLKILNTSVEQIAKDFHLPIQKGRIDYKKKRERGYRLTTEEIGYIRNDVEIVAMALDSLFKAGVRKSTIGASAMDYYKNMTVGFNRYFPTLPNDISNDIRHAYRGGVTYLNPIYKNKTIYDGITLDCNSEYPAMMASRLFPFAKPKIFEGEYKEDIRYPIYMISFTCAFELKKGKIPTVQIKDSPYYDPMEYLESSGGVPATLIMTSVDYKLFRDNYNVENIKFHGGYKFKARDDLFSDYINYWNKLKIDSKVNRNYSMYQISKKMMNSLYGKFGTKTKNILKEPVKMDDDIIHFENFKKEDRRATYVAVSAFTTAYGRDHLLRTAQKIRDWSVEKYGEDLYVYSDTDSITVRLKNREEDIEELKHVIDIHKYKLGAWKIEDSFKRAKYLRGKTYIKEYDDGTLDATIAGFPKNLAPLLNFDNFDHGFTTKDMTLEGMIELAKKNGATDDQIAKIDTNLRYKYVKGGIILEETGFTLK